MVYASCGTGCWQRSYAQADGIAPSMLTIVSASFRRISIFSHLDFNINVMWVFLSGGVAKTVFAGILLRIVPLMCSTINDSMPVTLHICAVLTDLMATVIASLARNHQT
jgi:hypothetical protein